VLTLTAPRRNITRPEAESALDVARLQSPREAIGYQLDLLRRGRLDLLRQCFVPRLRPLVTPEAVARSRTNFRDCRADDFMSAIHHSLSLGRYRAMIVLVTTLVWCEDRWLTETLWFL